MVAQIRPSLDPEFVPAALWNREYRKSASRPLAIALERSDGSVSVYRTVVQSGESVASRRYVERLLKFLLWQKGGYRVTIGGDAWIADYLRGVYAADGARAFDYDFM